MIIFVIFPNEVVVGLKAVWCLKVYLQYLYGKKSRYEETLNKNTHPQTCKNLTLILKKNTFIILLFTIHSMKVLWSCFVPDK